MESARPSPTIQAALLVYRLSARCVLKARWAVASLMSALLVLCLIGAPASAGLSSQMLQLTNHAREKRGRHSLGLNRRVSRKARRHSHVMARKGELTEVGLVKHLGWAAWGVNIGYTPKTLEKLQRVFMHSREHRRNILRRRFRHVGVGVVEVKHRIWATLIFYDGR